MNPRNYNVKIAGVVHLPRWSRSNADLHLVGTKCGLKGADVAEATRTLVDRIGCADCERKAY